MAFPRKNSIQSFALALCYGIGYYLLQYLLYKLHVVPAFPAGETLLNWDAGWYHSIAKDGYQYSTEEYSNSGFFILFPLLWKAVGLNPWTVSFVNIVLFAAGFALFNTLYQLRTADKLLWLTFPSFYIVFVPYSEALFIFLSTLAMWGIVKKKNYVIWVSLFLLSMTRPVAVILVPAFLIAELITNDRSEWWPAVRRFIFLYCLPLVAGLALFLWYQYSVTGVWMAYFKAQRAHWGHEFTMPVLPFGSAFGLRLLWLNAAALFLSFFTLLLLIGYGVKWLVKHKVQTDKLFILSCLYFTGIGLLTIISNSNWGSKGTNIFDLARYAFVTPFFWVLLHRFTINASYRFWDYLKIFLLLNVSWLCFESWQHIQKLLYFNLASLFILLYMWQAPGRLKWIRYAVLAGVGITFQVLMLQWYIAWQYPG
ncbi:MAG: hypothetical protein K8F30_06055 [Taibaiella sp.]|nr:hypothetical protein [Taibaiella sp.]